MKRLRITRTRAVVALVLLLLAGLTATTVAAQSLSARSNAGPQAAGTPAASTADATTAATGQATTVATQAAAPAAANATAGAAFITLNPQAGFPLDPFVVSLQGGGPVKASTLSSDCSGYIASAPSVTVNYAGKADVMRAFFYSDGDPVLVVKTPDGKYLCDDDTSPQILDPTIEIQKPAAGQYSVWVGSSAAKDLVPGFLVFTTQPGVDLGSFAVGNLVKRPALPVVPPLHERLAAAAQLLEQAKAAAKSANPITPASKPLTATITANGNLPALELTRGITGTRAISTCDGLISLVPDYVFNWSGTSPSVSVAFEGNADTTLVIRTPNGGVVCNDDAGGTNNVNPLAIIAQPADGTYLVWVGRIDPSKQVTGQLTVAPGADLKPKALPRAK